MASLGVSLIEPVVAPNASGLLQCLPSSRLLALNSNTIDESKAPKASGAQWTRGLNLYSTGNTAGNSQNLDGVSTTNAISADTATGREVEWDFLPILVTADIAESTLVRTTDVLDADTLGTLDSVTAWRVEEEFWAGTTYTAQRHLTSATATQLNAGAIFSSAPKALEALEQALTPRGVTGALTPHVGNGQPGVIHCTSDVFLAWASNNLISDPVLMGGPFGQQSRCWFTRRGTQVIPGEGYTGNGPSNATTPNRSATQAWAFATDMPVALIGKAVLITDSKASSYRRDVNTQIRTVQRPALAAWSGPRHYAALVPLP